MLLISGRRDKGDGRQIAIETQQTGGGSSQLYPSAGLCNHSRSNWVRLHQPLSPCPGPNTPGAAAKVWVRRRGEKRRGGEGRWKREMEEREGEDSNSKTLFYSDCSLGSVKPV